MHPREDMSVIVGTSFDSSNSGKQEVLGTNNKTWNMTLYGERSSLLAADQI